VKERLRLLLAGREPSKIRWRLADFYEAAIDYHLPEATRLDETIQSWRPAMLTALLEDVDNARTEGVGGVLGEGYQMADHPSLDCATAIWCFRRLRRSSISDQQRGFGGGRLLGSITHVELKDFSDSSPGVLCPCGTGRTGG
jgi:hypothetical protein